MTVVIDASVVVAALLNTESAGRWAEKLIAEHDLVAPHLLHVEVANILRRAQLAQELTPDAASLAFADLADLPVDLFPFEVVADRVWELRGNVTCYDAWYVALAELLQLPLASLDKRLLNAPTTTCAFITSPAQGTGEG